MAKVLQNYKPVSSSEYPWDEWFDGQTRLIVHGEDFTCTARSFQSACRAAAAKRNKFVSLTQYIDPEKHVKVEGSMVLVATERKDD